MIVQKLLYLLVTAAALVLASNVFGRDETENAISVDTLLSEGKMRLQRGQYQEAADFFRKASQIDTFEAPNFLPLGYLALASCKYGDRITGIAYLKQYQCALDVEQSRSPCWVTTRNQRSPKPNMALDSGCMLLMCNEIYLPLFEQPYAEKNSSSEKQAVLTAATKACDAE